MEPRVDKMKFEFNIDFYFDTSGEVDEIDKETPPLFRLAEEVLVGTQYFRRGAWVDYSLLSLMTERNGEEPDTDLTVVPEHFEW